MRRDALNTRPPASDSSSYPILLSTRSQRSDVLSTALLAHASFLDTDMSSPLEQVLVSRRVAG